MTSEDETKLEIILYELKSIKLNRTTIEKIHERKKEKVMNTGEMTEKIAYKGFARCTSGTFEGLHATKNKKGHVFLIEKDIAYDFFDNRFANCTWEIN